MCHAAGPPMADQAAPSFPTPATTLLVGRERELAVLRDALTNALAGRGSLVLIGGEAGIGKTALAEWLLAEAADQGALVLVGRCYDLAETPPYGPWLEVTARYPAGPGLPPLLVREARAQRLDLRPLDEGALRALAGAEALPPADAARLVAYLRERAE